MVKVFYTSKINAHLGGTLFLDGLAIFEDDKEGIAFADRYYLKYEVTKSTKKAKEKPAKKVATKKKVKADGK